MDDTVAGAGEQDRADRRTAIFPGLLVVFVAAYVWRMSGVLDVTAVTSHLSNFVLSGAAVTIISGPKAFVDPARRSRALLAAAALVAVNLVAEMLLAIGGADEVVNDAMGDVNTTDPIDGLSGILAVALVVAMLPWRRD